MGDKNPKNKHKEKKRDAAGKDQKKDAAAAKVAQAAAPKKSK